jgi:actin-related protein
MAIAKSDLGSRNNDYNNVSITALAEKLSKLSAQLTAYLDRVRNVYIRTACETNTDFIHISSERPWSP